MANELIRMAVLVAALTVCASTAGATDGNAEGNPQKQPPKPQQQHEPQKHKKQPAPPSKQQQQQQQAAEQGKKHGEGAGDAHDANDSASDSNKANDKRRARKRADGEADATDHAPARKADADSSAQDKPAKSEKNDKNQEQRHEDADHREQNQARRIHNGVKHGQLTPDEIGKLEAQEKALADSEAKFKSDGKLTRDESRQLQQQLNDASEQIWAQRHDTEGNQRSVVRLGKEVIARDDLTQRIESGELTGSEARKFAADFRKMIGIKKRLSSDDLAEDDRSTLQNEYDDLLGNYFQINEDKQSKEK